MSLTKKGTKVRVYEVSKVKMLLQFLIASLCVGTVIPSWGDKSSYHQMCVEHCTRDTCLDTDKHVSWYTSQPLSHKLIGITCQEDCRYTCMWMTVEEMEVRHGMATGN